MIQELDGEARACSSVLQTLAEVGQSTTRWRTSTEREDITALRMSWSCCFQVRNAWEGLELKVAEAAETVLDKSCGEGHGVEPSTNKKTP
jgi:hypothetical protein